MSKNSKNRGARIVSLLEKGLVTDQTVFCWLEEARSNVTNLEELTADGSAYFENDWWGAKKTLEATEARVKKAEEILHSRGRHEFDE